MNDVNYGIAPQREYKKGISLNVYQIALLGMVATLLFSSFTVGKIHKSLAMWSFLFVVVNVIIVVLPSVNNYGYHMFQEILFSVKFVCRRIYERILKHV